MQCSNNFFIGWTTWTPLSRIGRFLMRHLQHFPALCQCNTIELFDKLKRCLFGCHCVICIDITLIPR